MKARSWQLAVLALTFVGAVFVSEAQAQVSLYQATTSPPVRVTWLTRPSYASDSSLVRSVPVGSTTAVSDTTDPVSLTNIAGIPAGGPTPAALAFRLFLTSAKQLGDASGGVLGQSPDSVYVTQEISLDGGVSWAPAVAATGCALTNISSGPTVGTFVGLSTATALSVVLAPQVRFLIRAGDAAQINGLRMFLTYPKVGP